MIEIMIAVFLYSISKQTNLAHKAIHDGFRDMGGVYVKFLQLLALRTEFLKDSDASVKYGVFDRVEVDDIDVLDFLETNLSKDKLSRLTLSSPLPIAAGSFAQIYAGVIDGDRDVIIKILRPELSDFLYHDLRMMRVFVFFARYFTPQQISADIKSVFKDFKKSTIQETNYLEEVRFANQQYDNYKDNNLLFIPLTYNDFCTSNLIVQERLYGMPLTDIMLMHRQGADVVKYVAEHLNSDLTTQLEQAGFEYLYGIFTMGRIQGDPHPGNIFLLPENKIGIVDFGISAEAPDDLGGFLDLLRGFLEVYDGKVNMGSFVMRSMRFFSRDLYQSLMVVSKFQNGKGPAVETIEKALKNVADESFETNKGHVNLAQLIDQGMVFRLVNNTINAGNRFAIELDVDGALVTKAAQMYMMVLHSLGMKRGVMRNVFARTIEAVENNPEIDLKPAPQPDIASAIETITRWLEKVAERDPLLYRRLTNGARGK